MRAGAQASPEPVGCVERLAALLGDAVGQAAALREAKSVGPERALSMGAWEGEVAGEGAALAVPK